MARGQLDVQNAKMGGTGEEVAGYLYYRMLKVDITPSTFRIHPRYPVKHRLADNLRLHHFTSVSQTQHKRTTLSPAITQGRNIRVRLSKKEVKEPICIPYQKGGPCDECGAVEVSCRCSQAAFRGLSAGFLEIPCTYFWVDIGPG